jgi:hypothetical protein
MSSGPAGTDDDVARLEDAHDHAAMITEPVGMATAGHDDPGASVPASPGPTAATYARLCVVLRLLEPPP